MSRLDAFAAGAGTGALFVIACIHLGARYAGHHFLDVVTKEIA